MNLLHRIIAALRRRPAPHHGGWQDFETGRYVTDPHDEIAAAFDIDPDLLGPRGAHQNSTAERDEFLHGGLAGWQDNAYAVLMGPRDPRWLDAGYHVEDESWELTRERLRMWNERIPSTPTEKAMDAIRDAVEEIKLQPWQIEFLRRTAPDVYAHLRKIGALDQHPFPLRLSIHNAVRGNADATVYGMPIRVTPLVPRGEVWVQDSESLAMPYRFSIDETGTVVPKGWT